MAAAFQVLAFQKAPAFQTGLDTAVQPTPGSKYQPYPFDEIAREQRRTREAPVEPDHALEPEAPELRYPAKRSAQEQRADAERHLFALARERALAEALAREEAERLAEAQAQALAAQQAVLQALALQELQDEEAIRAFMQLLMNDQI